jgi:hypothetical protein
VEVAPNAGCGLPPRSGEAGDLPDQDGDAGTVLNASVAVGRFRGNVAVERVSTNAARSDTGWPSGEQAAPGPGICVLSAAYRTVLWTSTQFQGSVDVQSSGGSFVAPMRFAGQSARPPASTPGIIG